MSTSQPIHFSIIIGISIGFFIIIISQYNWQKSAFETNRDLRKEQTSGITSPELRKEQTSSITLPDCTDTIWCSVEMPSVSLFKFDAPVDERRWRIAQMQAARGEQILLSKIIKVFPNHYDYLDGDITFRKLHFAIDFFVDEKRDLSPLISSQYQFTNRKLNEFSFTFNNKTNERKLEEETTTEVSTSVIKSAEAKLSNGKLSYPWELAGKSVIPEPYNFRAAKRAPVVQIGYTAYVRDSGTYFTGNRIGGAFIERQNFFNMWKKIKDKIDTPFITVCALNENWGFLSTNFPNRTAGWGNCCDREKDKDIHDFLNHEKTLMLVTNQHTNMTHPKILIIPRGMPVTWGFTRQIIWDEQRNTLKNVQKSKLLLAATSSWGKRPQMIKCISEKMSPGDFDGHASSNKIANRLDRKQYYQKLGSAMFGLALPGLGYDTFRTWELMTMGTIVVLERGVGFDRTMWRLPALLVEDFDEVTPKLLRTAYVEALYRADEFEFERLTQSFWYSVIANVSATMSTSALLYKFPMKAEDPNFTRPKVPYECGKTNTCGPRTKRTPKSSC